MVMKKTYFFVFLGIIILGIYFYFQGSTTFHFLSSPMNDDEKFVVHMHPYLEIQILGNIETIPANIGIHQNGMDREGKSQIITESIHTHDAMGKIHVESLVLREFYLSQFFFVWNQTFNENCIFTYCVDENHTLTMYVNNVPNKMYGLLPLRDLDRIKIVYEEKKR